MARAGRSPGLGERRCFDPDDDGLYENFANTLISDAHHYSGGACTQASAYNYRALRLAARLAALLGEDPEPFQREAEKTLAAMNGVLWMPEWLVRRVSRPAGAEAYFIPVPSCRRSITRSIPTCPTCFQAYQMLRYVDTQIEHVPVEGDSAIAVDVELGAVIWSVRNVLASEVAHTALAYWQAGRREKAWNLYRGAIVDAMYASRVPGNCAGTSEHDGRWSGRGSDFSCSVGMFGRALVEGLFGIVPDVLEGELLIRPGLPRDWDSASIDTPDVGYTYSRNGDTRSDSRFDRN